MQGSVWSSSSWNYHPSHHQTISGGAHSDSLAHTAVASLPPECIDRRHIKESKSLYSVRILSVNVHINGAVYIL